MFLTETHCVTIITSKTLLLNIPIKKGNSHELPNSIFVNLKSNTIMKKLQDKGTDI